MQAICIVVEAVQGSLLNRMLTVGQRGDPGMAVVRLVSTAEAGAMPALRAEQGEEASCQALCTAVQSAELPAEPVAARCQGPCSN